MSAPLRLPITTARLQIRGLQRLDAQALYSYRRLPEVSRFQSGFPISVDHAREQAAAQDGRLPLQHEGWFQVVLLTGGQIVGDVGLNAIDDDQVEVGISLAPSAQGQGYATEALRALLDAVFEGRHRVVASVDPRNRPSVRLLRRLGMRREAHHIRSLRVGDEWVDDVIFAVLADEWIAKRS